MSTRDFEFTIRKDSTKPEGRERTLRRMRSLLMNFPSGVPDRANCFFHGLKKGWAVSEVIGLADADEIVELLPKLDAADVFQAIPNGREDNAPEVEALTDNQVLDDWWFHLWMGIKNDLYFFRRDGTDMPERSVLAWLGYLLGELEGKSISQGEYEKLRALLPPVNDDLTPLVVATP